MESKIVKIKCLSTKDLKKSINGAVAGIGGWQKFIRKGDKVLLKPNFNTADPYPASSDPEFIKAVIELVLASGAGKIIIADSSTMMAKTKKVMRQLKIFDLEKISSKVRVMPFEEGKWLKKKVPQGKFLKTISMPRLLEEVDKIIFLPCLKTHFIAKFTGAMKLAVGLMKPSERVALHCRNTEEKIAEICTVVSPDLVIMDARKIFITQGPTKGEVREPGLILAATDRLALDLEGIKIIKSFPGNALANAKAEDLGQIKRARELGIK